MRQVLLPGDTLPDTEIFFPQRDILAALRYPRQKLLHQGLAG